VIRIYGRPGCAISQVLRRRRGCGGGLRVLWRGL